MLLTPQVKTATQSVWADTVGETNYPTLTSDMIADIAVIGGGITGLTTAILLQQAGKRVVVIESGKIGSGVSGFNSGHLTFMLLDMKYSSILQNFGEAQAKLAAESQIASLQIIEELVDEYHIDCDFRYVPGFLYAQTREQLENMYREYAAARKLGVPCHLVETVPLPFHVMHGVSFPNQARIHPLKYVQALARQVAQAGHFVFENSHVDDIKHREKNGADTYTVETSQGSVTANHVVMATHTPLGLCPSIQTRLETYLSYVIGVRVKQSIPNGLFWDMEDPYHYTRVAEDADGPMLIIGGADHKQGEKYDTTECFLDLENYAYHHYNVVSVDYRWSGQLYNAVDGLPYIGRVSKNENLYVATGFSGEGLTGGTYAGAILCDLILGKHNRWAEVYSPSRIKPLASAAGFLSENVGTLRHFIGDRVAAAETKFSDAIAPGEGKILSCDGKKVAAYRDETGTLHTMSPVCSHMKCIVQWNSAEKTWDCPCHGARFSAEGQVMNGPAMHNLESLD